MTRHRDPVSDGATTAKGVEPSGNPSPGRLTIGRAVIVASALAFLASAPLIWRVSARGAAAPAKLARATRAATEEMAALLEQRAAAVNPVRLPYAINDRRADLLRPKLRSMPPSAERFNVQLDFAMESLNAGRIDDSLRTMGELKEDLQAQAPAEWSQYRGKLLVIEALAYLRMAELQNCCQASNRDSCLLPIQGEGVHEKREGATRAAELLEEALEAEPGHLRAPWLLNIAHMTLGSYPEGVPERHLIPPSAFASEYPLPRFTNLAQEAGVDALGLAGGAILDDFDEDGDLDLMVSHMGFQEQTRFFSNRGDGTFEDRTEAAGLIGETGGLNMIHADYDNDGFVDPLVLRGGWMGPDGRFPLSLLRNNGDGTFGNVTVEAGLLRFAPTQTATWLDYDGDGWLDLFVGNESSPGDPYPCHLFHSNRDGTFTDVAREAGVDLVAFVKGVVSGDYDNDGRPDLYLSVHSGDNVLFHNDGPRPGGGWSFTNVAREAGVLEPLSSFATFFFDYDNDGWLDLYVAGYGFQVEGGMPGSVAADYLGVPTEAERPRLYRNLGNGRFEDVTKLTGLYRVVPAMGLNFGDLDNDGFLDIYLSTGNPEFGSLVPNRMFRNAEGRMFQDVTTAGNFGHLQKGHGVAFGDVDGDGDQDVFAQMGGAYLADTAYSTLYENPGTDNRWVGLDLEGMRSNRKALGARIAVTVETAEGEQRTFHRTVSAGGSFGASPFRQHVGLGDAKRIVAVEILWPATGATQAITGIEPGRWHHIREDGP